jgi:hypothetical protein
MRVEDDRRYGDKLSEVNRARDKSDHLHEQVDIDEALSRLQSRQL